MQQIGKLTTGKNNHPDRSSQTGHIAAISAEKQSAMGDVLDRWRLNLGWNVLPDDSQLASIATFVASLDRERVPVSAYGELYERAVQLRTQALISGKQMPPFGVELMLACWPSLRSELRQREIDAGRTLTASAQSQCLRCYGTGLEQLFDDKGVKLGVRPGCQHEHVDTTEPTAAGIDAAIDALHRPGSDETAEEICNRVRRDLARMFATAASDEEANAAWSASRTWSHAARYCRERELRGEMF